MSDPVFDQPARVTSVRIDGAHHIRQNFLDVLVRAQLAKPRDETVLDALRTARDVGHYLVKSDVFQHVEARLEPGPAKGDIDIVFRTKEKGRYYLRTATEVGNNEGTASATGHIRNVFGGGEWLEASISTGTKTRRAFNGTFSAPLDPTLDTRGEVHVYASDKDNTSFASCTELLRGARAVLRRGDVRFGLHEMGYEAVLRHLGGLSESASLSIREAAGQTVKSFLFHNWTRDTRDNAILGTYGSLIKLRHEFAGVGGDVRFYKVEGEGQLCRRVVDGVHLSLGARAGLLHSLAGPSRFPDRFQLGGPTSVRSFRVNSLGPRDGPDAVGGDLMWAAGASLITDIPRVRTWPLKAHFYLNAGQLDSLQNSLPLAEAIRASLSRPSVSAGLGLIYMFDPVRVELNFGVPLIARRSDGFRRGVQFGIGVDFL
ncbi:surface antigen-domain-containing protein [Vararia minispora EC-137]|uniref:Surface antigen-domain-containing protein n=1 Tax=Vararia minispora EC-137 TaxID=1314806 RepID=A0ACB8QJU9_9AGAM|nr:surface antigen-domain-containing protein [Vararia minispora EC-137]